jgi:hypothetical protein
VSGSRDAVGGTQPPSRQVRADFDAETIVVYQAYPASIAGPAVAAQRFVAPFSRERMTWIKPSFLWMMYRCGWATKPGQERVLAVRMTRAGFEEALASSCLSHFNADVHPDHDAWQQRLAASPVRVQWDPERDAALNPLPWRSLQVGLGRPVVPAYVDAWVVGLEDITGRVHRLHDLPVAERTDLPDERPYPLPLDLATTLGATSG